MNLKKTLILLVTLCLAFSLCACGDKEAPEPANSAAMPSPSASAAPEASPDAAGTPATSPVSQQGGSEQLDPVMITADEAENIALNDAMTDRGVPQNVKSYEAREGDSVVGWTVEFDLTGQHWTYLIDLVAGDILDVQVA